MGIASLAMAISAVLSIVLLIIVVSAAHNSFHLHKIEGTSFSYLLGWWIFLTGLLCVCGIVFGVGGLRQQNRRHSLATIGLCINIALPLGLMFILVIGASMYDPASGELVTAQNSQTGSFSVVAICAGVAVAILFYLGWRLARRLIYPYPVAVEAVDLIECRKCKKAIPSTSQFCRRCGTGLTDLQHSADYAL